MITTRRRRSYRDQVALITGGASGIGLAIGRRLARDGAAVTLADLDGGAAQAAADDINREAPVHPVVGCTLDVRDEQAFRSVVESIVAPSGRIDLLVNNAGMAMGGPTHELTSAHWARIIDVNLRGVANGLLAVYPRMVEQGHGQIVNTASGVGLVAPPYVVAYAATKHAVVGLSAGLRPEAARHGVTVSVLCPGSVETPILDRLPDQDLPAGDTPAVTARDFVRVLGFTPMPADAFAERVVRAMAREKAFIVEPRDTRIFWHLHRLSPRLSELVCRRIAAKVDRELLGGS